MVSTYGVLLSISLNLGLPSMKQGVGSMKYRLDFVTNSSSSHYLIRNMSSKSVAGIPPYSTISAWEGWGDNTGQGDFSWDKYDDPRLIIEGDGVRVKRKPEPGPVKLIVISENMKEEEFDRLFGSFKHWPAILEEDASVLDLQKHKYYDDGDIYYEQLDLERLDEFKNLERIEINGISPPVVSDWSSIPQCGKLREMRFVSKYRVDFKGMYETVTELRAVPELDRIDLHFQLTSLMGGTSDLHDYNGEELAQKNWPSSLTNWKIALDDVPERNWYYAQCAFLANLRMNELAGYMGNPLRILEEVTDSMEYSEARECIYGQMINLLSEQIEQVGITHFLDVDALAQTKAAALIPEILKARKNEMKDVVVPVFNDKVYLMPLALTAYGFQMLLSGEYRLDCSMEEVEILAKEMEGLGFKLKTKKVSEKPDFNHVSASSLLFVVMNNLRYR